MIPHHLCHFAVRTIKTVLLLVILTTRAGLEAQTVLSIEPFYVFGLIREPFEAGAAGTAVEGSVRLGALPLSIALEGGFRMLGVAPSGYASSYAAAAGLSYGVDIGSGLKVGASLVGGASWTSLTGASGTIYAADIVPYGRLGLGLALPLSASMSFGPQAAMRWDAGLGFLMDAGVALSYTIRGTERSVEADGPEGGTPRAAAAKTRKAAASRIAFEGEPSLETIFPVFFKYYENHSLGSIKVKNAGSTPLTDIRVSFHLKQYMDGPFEKRADIAIAPGETATIPVYALLNDSILDVTESTKTQVELAIRAKSGSAQIETTITSSIRVADRNAMTWIDDRAAAAFITAKDPAVLTFAKGTIGGTKAAANASLNRSFVNAMAIHEALCEAGIEYVTDPKSSYGQAAKGSATIDFLLFPRQTMEYRAGDCDDLSILYCALLEAIGVETAFITVPGHIYIAAALGISQDESRAAFKKTDNLIFRDGAAWLPIEVTERKGGFLSAWEEGAKQWREAKSRDQAGFFPIHEAWSTFEPVGLPGSATVPLPDASKVSARLVSESVRFVEKEISDQVARLQAQLRTAQEESKVRNELGVLYARYGLTDRAAQEFGKAIAKKEHLGALVNLGHLSYMQKELEKALALYERALKVQPKSALVLLSLARVNHDMENYGAAKKFYTDLKAADPGLAERFSYLELRGDEGARAAEISGARGVMVWSE